LKKLKIQYPKSEQLVLQQYGYERITLDEILFVLQHWQLLPVKAVYSLSGVLPLTSIKVAISQVIRVVKALLKHAVPGLL
jgi:hypothetical protein